MKIYIFKILILLCPFFMNGQVNIGSITILPITGTNDIELRVYSYCSQIHNLNNYEYINTPENIINLCYIDTGLLMPSDFTSSIVLPGINTTGIQTITVNGHYNYFLGPGEPCNTNVIGGTPASLTFETPLTQPRMFTLSNNTFEINKGSLHPNPNNGAFSIDLPKNTYSVELIISDLSGKKIFSTASYFSGDIIHLNGLSKGVYFATVVDNQATEILKFVVQ